MTARQYSGLVCTASLPAPGGRGYLISSAAMHQVMKRDWCERRKTAAYGLPANMNCGFERELDAR
jgi:hypothetical protein